MADFDASSEDLRPPQQRPPFDRPAPDTERAPVREGLPSSYRMRADRHYVDLLASRTPHGRERAIPVASFEAPGITDVPALVPLIDSVRQHGILQPLLVQEINGALRIISGQRRLAAAIAAGLRDVPCIVYDVDDVTAGRLRDASNLGRPAAGALENAADTASPPQADEELSRAFNTLSGLADLMSGPLSDLSRGVVSTLLRAELWRASHLQQATRYLRAELPVVRAAVPAAALVERVLHGFLPERRARHVDMSMTADLPLGHLVIVDERLVATAIAGAIMATLPLLEGLPASRLLVAVSVEATRAVNVTVAQDHVRPPSAWVDRAFDRTWHDRPGGMPAVVWMAAMQHAAIAHGGDALAVASARGSRLALTIPVGA